jgi:hypothetical protein
MSLLCLSTLESGHVKPIIACQARQWIYKFIMDYVNKCPFAF